MAETNENNTAPNSGVTNNTPGTNKNNTAQKSGVTNNTPGTKTETKKTVEVDAEVLAKLVAGYEKMEQQVQDLTQAADLGRLTKIQSIRQSGKLIKKAKLNVYDGKIVVGWAKVADDVYFDESGKAHEDQQIQLFLDEGQSKTPSKTKPMSYRSFSRLTTKIEGEVVKESKESDGSISYKVQLPDGREFELPITFLN